MAYRGTCKLEKCDYTTTGKTKEEVYTDLEKHSEEKHGETLSPDMQNRVLGAKREKVEETED